MTAARQDIFTVPVRDTGLLAAANGDEVNSSSKVASYLAN